MTIWEFLTIYERNHVAFLKNSLGTIAPPPPLALPVDQREQAQVWPG